MTDEKKRFDVNPDHDPPGVETPRAGGSDFEWSREIFHVCSPSFSLMSSSWFLRRMRDSPPRNMKKYVTTHKHKLRRLIGSILFSLRSHSFSRAKANSGSFFELVGFFRAPLFRKALLSLDVEGVGSPKMRKSATIADTSPLAVEAVTVLQ